MRCPEQTITDIVLARVKAEYQARINAIFNPLAVFWQSEDEKASNDALIARIQSERDALIANLELSGVKDPGSDAVGADKQAHVAEAEILYPRTYPGPGDDPEEWKSAIERRRERVNYLTQYLSPEDLLTYRIQEDGDSRAIGRLLRGLNPSEEEFRRVFQAIDGEDLGRTNGQLSASVENKLAQALGQARYSEYREQASPRNSFFNDFVYERGISDEQIAQLRALREQAIQTGLPTDQYKARVRDLLGDGALVQEYFSSELISGARVVRNLRDSLPGAPRRL
ncbi:MAG TPA: hypothetical protein VHH88_12290 [Verrucomicrobiae bacterium]|nr:hypothetical protein [Verrucomicrobiae bacterium]